MSEQLPRGPGRPKKQAEYIIAKGTDPKNLIVAVNRLMADGYSPIGGPFAHGRRMHQAMVK